MEYILKNGKIDIDYQRGIITNLTFNNIQLLSKESFMFEVELRNKNGDLIVYTPESFLLESFANNTAIYTSDVVEIKVFIQIEFADNSINWKIRAENGSDYLIETISLPNLCLKPLVKNGGIGEIVFPYNEGALVDDISVRESDFLNHKQVEYPSLGIYPVFPNMICSQFISYLFNGCGLYIGAHDKERGTKVIDFIKINEGVMLQNKYFTNANYGEDVNVEFPIVWKFFVGDWHDGVEIYREWFKNNLPSGVKKICENDNIPSWYGDFPLVVAYPIRGQHDTDEMLPNNFYPYTNGLETIDKIAEKTNSKLLVLLMHWEGTAPWAPPYVWPPFGEKENFNEYKDELHKRGHLLGVYCSGFGYTEQSNIFQYNCKEKLKDKSIFNAFCVGPNGKIEKSKICNDQRFGYDLCVCSEKAREILDEAYNPLFEQNLDYIQILDQNHGGGQYLCYSKNHGHSNAPGKWMTKSMQEYLTTWNEKARNTLFGCESASSEPFIGNLLFSDNRFELNYYIGKPIPIYSYIYHEYLHNFMGNQVCSPFNSDGLLSQLAYSFVAGDALTIVLNSRGFIQTFWGMRKFDDIPNQEKVLEFLSNLRKCYNENRFLGFGKMIKPVDYKCKTSKYRLEKREIEQKDVFSSAWEFNKEKKQLFVNHTLHDAEIVFSGKKYVIKSLQTVVLDI